MKRAAWLFILIITCTFSYPDTCKRLDIHGQDGDARGVNYTIKGVFNCTEGDQEVRVLTIKPYTAKTLGEMVLVKFVPGAPFKLQCDK